MADHLMSRYIGSQIITIRTALRGYTMTIMIGIHQKQDKVDKLYESMGLYAASLTAIGPFVSKEEALAWQQDLTDKITDSKIIEPAGSEDALLPWYGFSFEK